MNKITETHIYKSYLIMVDIYQFWLSLFVSYQKPIDIC